MGDHLMSWFTNLFTGGAGSVVDSIGGLADRFIQTDDEKSAFKVQVETLLQKRDSEIEQTLRQTLQSKEKILVAELSQGDNYTKRARPTVVYTGLIFIGINYVLFPLIGRIANGLGADIDASPLADLPAEFWIAWGGICATWSIGRSMEKRGTQNAATRAITGNTPTSKLLD
jgi:hypothetical protein